MKTVADKAVAQECKKIIDRLMSRTLDGDPRCAKMLFSLAEPQQAHREKTRRRLFRSAALMLGSEAEWKDEPSAAPAEMAAFGQ